MYEMICFLKENRKQLMSSPDFKLHTYLGDETWEEMND